MRQRVLGIVVLIILVAGGVALAVHHNSTKSSPSTASTNPYSQTSTTPTTSTPNNTSSQIIQTKTDPNSGEYLADGGGKPLYTYGGDTTGTSNCTGSCLNDWPIYAATSSSASLPTNVTTITRSDSKVQYAYKGMPLYYFSPDGAGSPGGDGLSNFHLAKP